MTAQPSFSAEDLEQKLSGALQRVRPSPKFTAALRERIQTRPMMQIEQPRLRLKAVLLSLGGAISFSLLVVAALRTLWYLLRRSRLNV